MPTRPACTAPSIRASGAASHRLELEELVTTPDGPLEHRSDAPRIELVVDRTGLERGPLPREEGVLRGGPNDRLEEPDDAEVVFGMALVELLPVRLPHPWA